ncbi:hypothetical protein BA1DRAFT_02711 [Photorhabdus aegyptia]|uniref:Uncharacterized protein n=1 Tax=Photorhabdus aegyptia TaxID=2805098 RepID=A0A022PIJ4_9GAMM|nr:hypothetical protein BA1DRAFT_02711 [Photorhabdus aegyptia]
MNREIHVRLREGLRVRSPRATRLDDPHPCVPHEEVKARFAAKKAALLKGI